MMIPIACALSAAFSTAALAAGPEAPEAPPSLVEEAAASAPASLPSQGDSGRWDITFTPYGWLPSINARTSGGKVELSLNDIVDDLDAVFFSAIAAQKVGSPWGFVMDAIYFALEDKPVKLQATVLTTKVTYKVFEDRPHKLTFGARYWDVDVSAGPLGGGTYWLDLVVGASTQYRFNDKWSARLLGDVGGFGIGTSARLTTQVFGSLDYQLNDKVTFIAGYRYLDVDQEQKTTFDTDVFGPIIGASIRL